MQKKKVKEEKLNVCVRVCVSLCVLFFNQQRGQILVLASPWRQGRVFKLNAFMCRFQGFFFSCYEDLFESFIHFC